MNLFVLAAGEGTRFRPHTQILPKPGIPFCGLPLLYYSYFLTRCLSPQKLVINTFHLPEGIHKVGRSLEKFGVRVVFSDEQPLLLGSAGGMAKAKSLLCDGADFVAINADEVIVPRRLQVMRDYYSYSKQRSELATLMVMEHPEAGKKFGAVWVNREGYARGFGKVPPETTEVLRPYHFIGPMYFKKRIFNYLTEQPSNILHDVLKAAIAQGEEVRVFPIECEWFETGNLADYLDATGAVLQLFLQDVPFLHEMKTHLMADYEWTVTSTATILKHKTSVVESQAQVGGFLVLGPHCRVAAGASVHNVVCAENVEIKSNQVVQNQLILQY
jgi:mannose-1-phosphate guanylyltransferase